MKQEHQANYAAPDTRYFKTQIDFDKAVSKDFINAANQVTLKKQKFLVCLSHGQSPAGAYQQIVHFYQKIKKPENVFYTFLNSPLKSQENLENVFTATVFLEKLLQKNFITPNQILADFDNMQDIDAYATTLNDTLEGFLQANNKTGFDYVFMASNPKGSIGAIERNSSAFQSDKIIDVVNISGEKKITVTPQFLLQTKRIAFLATKADKRRPLAWLYSTTGKEHESPSFIRYIENVEERVAVFIDDTALTWPQIEIKRETPYGVSKIRVDVTYPYKENAKVKLPVIVMVHGFLGLNSYDGLLTTIPTTKYIAAAMHYGTIPTDLPLDDYSKHVAQNIDAVIGFFGAKGHPVYLFDHSMGNIYFLMMDKNPNDYKNVKKYLRGRIGANPFFGEEAKHALLGFLDNVIIPSMSFTENPIEKSLVLSFRRVAPLDSKSGVRKRGINLAKTLVGKEESNTNAIWDLIKSRIVFLMSNMDSLPHLNRIPIEKALNKVPAKVFGIQVYSALKESIQFDKQTSLVNSKIYNIPILILKSERDGVAKFVPRIYENEYDVEIIDVTNYADKDLFREHLYHMVNPQQTVAIIDKFISKIENDHKSI
ncbi:MAG TPA: 6-phosphogluconolactonase [Chitinophagales bacterium]|nr:6-phosphogluconolactonase [Chitinophagales bacterium]HNC72730.1 6-phosphogluconolactonase [Chitinophagales bacterium]HND82513.1 6-phosphogluconolactonase [Chitinophagales bacterium]HNF19621.1 6-phosphogluconolactonase [Chitinophagales bacterium]HNG72236.1 6-phosphogluconolactonase [Chitinophagales bacterium]